MPNSQTVHLKVKKTPTCLVKTVKNIETSSRTTKTLLFWLSLQVFFSFCACTYVCAISSAMTNLHVYSSWLRYVPIVVTMCRAKCIQ